MSLGRMKMARFIAEVCVRIDRYRVQGERFVLTYTLYILPARYRY
jgi:hypothetical protein